MNTLLSKVRTTMSRLVREEEGRESMEMILLLAAIILPLLGLLIVYRGEITEWVSGKWSDTKSDANNYDPSVIQAP